MNNVEIKYFLLWISFEREGLKSEAIILDNANRSKFKTRIDSNYKIEEKIRTYWYALS